MKYNSFQVDSLTFIMQSESQNGNRIEREEEEWSIDWWRTEHSNEGKFIEVQKLIDARSDHHTFNLFEQKEDGIEWNQIQFNKKAQRKLQNKLNAKKTRERKKEYLEELKVKNELLEKQNQRLREQKLCWRCAKPLNNAKTSRIQCHHFASEKTLNKINHQKQFSFKELEPQTQQEQRRGKLWIVLGLLMLVLGIQIHGVYGGDEKSIRIPSSDLQKFNQEYKNTEDKHTIRMKTKHQSFPVPNSKEKGMKFENFLSRLSIENDEQYHEIEDEDEEQFQLDKDLLYAIQAEFEGIGRYI